MRTNNPNKSLVGMHIAVGGRVGKGEKCKFIRKVGKSKGFTGFYHVLLKIGRWKMGKCVSM